jgi:hypothetical protein
MCSSPRLTEVVYRLSHVFGRFAHFWVTLLLPAHVQLLKYAAEEELVFVFSRCRFQTVRFRLNDNVRASVFFALFRLEAHGPRICESDPGADPRQTARRGRRYLAR